MKNETKFEKLETKWVEQKEIGKNEKTKLVENKIF